MPPIIDIDSCVFRYPKQAQDTLDLRSFQVRRCEHLFLHGRSGSGKSTFLNLLCGILEPTSGDITILGQVMSALSASQKDRFRADNFGTIFQQFNLLPYLSVRENIALSCAFSSTKRADVKDLDKEIVTLLDALGLPPRALHAIAMELSIGEQQRVAVARALIGKPPIIIADEPTSALDSDTKESFMKVLFEQVERQGSTLIFVSHDQTLAEHFDTHHAFDEINRAGR